jgi:hypothetical protein
VAIDTRVLGAIRAGVLAAGVVVEDNPLLPRAFQLGPFKVAHGAAGRSASAQTAKVGRRYNNGRMRGVRDWDIISGREMKPGWDEGVKMTSELWEWFSIERIGDATDEEMCRAD